MHTLDEIRAALKDRNLKQVADSIGIHQNALYRLMSGATNPSYSTVIKLVEYLRNNQLGAEGKQE